jgi:TP901 family phage tail tape measure protein
MADRESAFVISFDGKAGDLSSVLDALKRKIRSDVSEIEAVTSKVELFKQTKTKADEASAAFFKLRERADELRYSIQRIEGEGGKVGTELTAALRATEKQAAAANREFARQSDALAKLNEQLRVAGVDTAKLASEEARLAVATQAAAKAAAEQQARAALGVKSTKETAAEVQRLQAAYETLRRSGAPLAELAQAQRSLALQTAQLRTGTGGLAESFTAMRGVALGAAAAIGGVAFAVREAVAAAREYETAVARIGTVTSLSADQLGALGNQVRGLAQTLGFDVQEGLRAVYDLLRAGVPAGNVLEVLATADDAAKAGITSLGESAKLAGILVRGFGIDAANLKPALDALFVSAQNGGATFAELAQGLGELAPVAKATGTPIEEVAAALQVMTRAGLDAPSAIGQLTQMLTRLASPETIANLRSLGIESGGLVDTLQQIGARGLSVGEILSLGVSSKKAAAGVAALTADASALSSAMQQIGASSGALDKASESLNRLNAEAVERLVQSLRNLQTTLGQIVTPSVQLINALSSLVQLLDAIAQRAQRARESFGGLGGVLGDGSSAALGLLNPVALVERALLAAGVAAAEANRRLAEMATQATATAASVGDAESTIAAATAAQAEAARARLGALRAQLAALVPELGEASKSIQSASQAAIASINSQADAQVAALNKLRGTEEKNAEAIVAIQKRAATDRLAIIQKAAADAIAAANLEADARRAAAGKSKVEIDKVEREIADSKRATLASIIGQFEAHVGQLLAIERGHLNRVAELNETRIATNRAIEEKIREIRRGNLTEYEQYSDRVRQIDETISAARKALAEGDLKAAEQFAKQAIEFSSGIATAVRRDGDVVVSQYSAQETAIGKIRAAQEVLNRVVDERVDAEKEGAEATKTNLETSKVALSRLREEYDALNERIAQGIEIKVTTTAAEAVAAAKVEIDSLNGRNTTSTHTVRVVTVEGNASGGMVGDKLAAIRARMPAARSGVQRFARGGAVFRRPAWSKVPGSGNGDTVPAALQAGSFVIRKAASRYYGDGMLRALAGGGGVQRFALGGPAGSLPLLGGKIGDFVFSRLSALGSGTRDVEGVNYQELSSRLIAIVEAARGLPHSSSGLDIGAWASALWNMLPVMTPEKMARVAKVIDETWKGILTGAENARAFGVPFVVADDLAALLFARGGGGDPPNAGTDTIPALLTPGEWVIKRPAVQRYGAGLLHAINSMRLPRETLAGMLRGPAAPRVQRFADGGPVAMAGSGASAPSGGGGGAGAITVNVTAAAGSLLSEDNVRRFVVPVLRDIQQRSK